MDTARTIPADVVRTLALFAEGQGWDVEELLSRAGISPLSLSSARPRVTEEQAVAVVQQVWRMTDDEMFGLSRHPLPRGTFRMLCYALLGAVDLRDALQRLQGFLRAVPAIPIRLEIPEGVVGEVILEVRIRPRSDFDRLALVAGLGSAHRLLAWMLRRNVDVIRIELPFEAPDDLETLGVMLDGPMTFGSERAAVVWDASWLGSPTMRDERDIEELIATSPRTLIKPPRYRSTAREQVRRMLESGLRQGEVPSADVVAARLAISPQTLRRRLADEGTSVRELTEVVRRDAAIAALVSSDESVADLAQRLGFSEPSAFVRAFRKWTGATPGAYRRGEAEE